MSYRARELWNEVRTYIDKADIEFLCCVAPLEVPPGIHIIVTDNSSDDTFPHCVCKQMHAPEEKHPGMLPMAGIKLQRNTEVPAKVL